MSEAKIPAHARTEQFLVSRLSLLPRNWPLREIGSVCSLIVDCPHTTPTFRDEGVLVARTTNIRDGRFVLEGASYVDEQEYRARILRAEPQVGDVIFTREAPVGEAFVVPSGMRVCLGQRVMLLRPDPSALESVYLLSQIYSGIVRSRISTLTAGTTNPHLNVGEVRGFLLPVPPMAEQRRIAEIIEAAEAAIRSREQFVAKLEQVRRAIVDELLYARRGGITAVPASWIRSTLGEHIDLIAGQHIAAEFCNREGEGTAYYTGPADFLGEIAVVSQFTTRPRVMCEEGDILLTVKGSGCGRTALASAQACISRQLMAVRPKGGIKDREFWFELIKSRYAELNAISSSGLIPGLSRKQIAVLPVFLPPEHSRRHIASVLTSASSRIRHEKDLVEKLRLLKRALVDELLTGRVQVGASE